MTILGHENGHILPLLMSYFFAIYELLAHTGSRVPETHRNRAVATWLDACTRAALAALRSAQAAPRQLRDRRVWARPSPGPAILP